jgi:hypothetical protein
MKKINETDEIDLDELKVPIKEPSKPIKKEAKKTPALHYYDVKIECMLPATLTYRVLAEDAVQAAEMIKGKSPNSVAHKLIGRKELVLKVYDAGSSMIRLVLNTWKK